MDNKIPRLQILLEKLNLTPNLTEKDKFTVDCPFASYRHVGGEDRRPSAVLFFDELEPFFYCSACHMGGPLAVVIRRLYECSKDPTHLELVNLLKDTDFRLLRIFQILANLRGAEEESDESVSHVTTVPLPDVAVRYLLNRNVSEDAIETYRLAYDELRFRIVFPKITKLAAVPGVGRDITGQSQIKYYNYISTGDWVGGNLTRDTKRLFIVEGFFDLLVSYKWAWELDADVVCTWKCTVSDEQVSQLSKYNKIVYLWYDNDLAGKKGAVKSAHKLKKYFPIVRRVMPESKDVGSMSQSEFNKIFEEYKNVKAWT